MINHPSVQISLSYFIIQEDTLNFPGNNVKETPHKTKKSKLNSLLYLNECMRFTKLNFFDKNENKSKQEP